MLLCSRYELNIKEETLEAGRGAKALVLVAMAKAKRLLLMNFILFVYISERG